MKLTLEQQYMVSALHSQNHACWCTGDFRSQGIINRHGIDPQKPEYSVSSIRRVKHHDVMTLWHGDVFHILQWHQFSVKAPQHHGQFDCLFNVYKLITEKKNSKAVHFYWQKNPTQLVAGVFTSQKSWWMWKSYPCHDVIAPCRFHCHRMRLVENPPVSY